MFAVLSDIHGNKQALESVIEDMESFPIEGIILLGDLIDYGMQSNEVIELIRERWQNKVICNIWGNHEKAILTSDYSCFSSLRGVESAKHTAAQLKSSVLDYLQSELTKSGLYEFGLADKRILAVHGSLEDHYWKSIDCSVNSVEYSKFDVVLSGHSHYSHMFTKFYEAEDNKRRNKHAVIFINPGSVGQPRNHIPFAQYALLDVETMSVFMRAVKYDVVAAMSLFDGSRDVFYKERLMYGV